MSDPTETHKAELTAIYVFHGRETTDELRDHVGRSCVITADLTDEYDEKRRIVFADGYTAIAFADELAPLARTPKEGT